MVLSVPALPWLKDHGGLLIILLGSIALIAAIAWRFRSSHAKRKLGPLSRAAHKDGATTRPPCVS
jgi:hypothetical protein